MKVTVAPSPYYADVALLSSDQPKKLNPGLVHPFGFSSVGCPLFISCLSDSDSGDMSRSVFISVPPRNQ